MPHPLTTALEELRPLLLDPDRLVRAVAAGRRRGQEPPEHERVELRPVALRSGPHLQAVARSGPRVSTRNAAVGEDAERLVEELLALPFGNWHVETAAEVVQLRVTKRGEAQLHRAATSKRQVAAGPAAHDRAKQRLVDPADPLFTVLGAGADKRRQVDAFVRLLAPLAPKLLDGAAGRELRMTDLGCGNAYLTFAAHRWLGERAAEAGTALRTVGVDVREDVVARSRELAGSAGLAGLDFATGTIAGAVPFGEEAPDVVLALHACDTATDEALARAVRWGAPVVLAAPCCHHDVQRQLQGSFDAVDESPAPPLVRHPILRERFADVLTDSLRALLLRLLGYRTDVVEFVDSRHTPRNALLRAVRTGAPARPELVAEYRQLTAAWRVEPALARMLRPEVDAVLGA
ncbi:methyltransferase family protein [Kineococcus xinjiangensis]|uniref:Methyltransferase family protein n=1 Tax=Kineococcus xinjiangensis TaxID=512762 RepID=A0A2S6ISX4_9ACTN|nr:SAM-dependent methyltransferase [Kineococcus xinjiangensis]PPK97353.1 methyltransferase family protein [Kineococcus xinjiangensis]